MKLQFGDYMIRDWQAADAPILTRYANNKKIWLNLRDGFPHPYQISDALRFIRQVAQQMPRTFFAIADSTEVIGSIALKPGKDVHRFTAEMGYWLAEPFWNQGIMSRAIAVFTDFAFETFPLTRIYAEPYSNNTASARALERAGFVREGILKAAAFKDRKVLDVLLYAKTHDVDPLVFEQEVSIGL